MKLIFSSYVLGCYLIIFTCNANAGEIHVAAATSLTHVLEEVSHQFGKATGHTLKISFASSGTLTHQIMQGAPFEVFLSANNEYTDLLADKGFTTDKGRVYGYGYLVLFVPEQSNLGSLAGYISPDQILRSEKLRKLVIANPQHAPYGYIAKQYLRNIGMWDEVYHRIVYANNASQATQFGLSGVADAAFIPLSQMKVMDTSNKGRFVLIDQTDYEPLKHIMVLMRHAGQASREFRDFLLGEKGQDILASYGFAKTGL